MSDIEKNSYLGRNPERGSTSGDKYQPRTGQMGTYGLKQNRADMPFTKSGLVPDIVINPNVIPKCTQHLNTKAK